ncbi:MAG: HAMP domain-containing protein [Cytophagales bacterium]|nr:MAG: HAMP domain-containing protein [Cytophagales bacterium]TAF61523.1 MAG: HAMP domain-containing protein [Cytophagales bacterium]
MFEQRHLFDFKNITLNRKIRILFVVVCITFLSSFFLLYWYRNEIKQNQNLLRISEQNINSLHKIAFYALSIQKGEMAYTDNLVNEANRLKQNIDILLKGGYTPYLDMYEEVYVKAADKDLQPQVYELYTMCQEHQVSISKILKNIQPLDSTNWEVYFLASKHLQEPAESKLSVQNNDSSATDVLALQDPIESDYFTTSDKQFFKLKKIKFPVFPLALKLYSEELGKHIYHTERLAEEIAEATHEGLERKLAWVAWLASILVLASVLILVMLLRFLYKAILAPINMIQNALSVLAQGGTVKHIHYPNADEIGNVVASINQLTAYLQSVTGFANKVGQEQFDAELVVRSKHDVLALALQTMRENLKKNAQDDLMRNWINEGVAQFGELLRKNHLEMSDFTGLLLSYIIKYVQANQGAFFIISSAEPDQVELTAAYAYNKPRFLYRHIKFGEGLVGQVLIEKKSILLKNVPNNYTYITSGIGEATPKCLLIVPLVSADKVYGALEIASFQVFEPHEIDLLEKLCESMASAVASLMINKRTASLLSESQEFAEQMRAQEEEMVQTIEELAATQETMNRNQQELKREELKLTSLLNTVSDFKVAFNQHKTVTYINAALQAYTLRTFKTQPCAGDSLLGVFPPAIEQAIFELVSLCAENKAAHKIVNIKNSQFQDVYYYLLMERLQDTEQTMSYVLSLRDVTWLQPVRFREVEIIPE